MPVTIPLDASYFGQDVLVEFQLVDQYERPYPAEITAATGFIAGIKRVTIDSDGGSITLPYNDEIPTPPGQAASSRWLINVVGDRIDKRYLSGIISSAPITTWNELIGASGDVDADSVFEGRLLPADATTGYYVRKAAEAWEAISLATLVAAIEADLDSSGRLLPESPTEGDIVLYTGGAWTATDTLPIA